MWRLVVSEGTGPWLTSVNNFCGRQVWEFDRDSGTPEERAEVERARRRFTEDRFEKRESQDLLMQMQYAKGKYLKVDRPMIKLDETAEVTEEILLASLRQALNQHSTLQAPDGHWPAEYSGVLFIMPIVVFALYVTGSLNTVLSSEHRHEICRYLYNHQNEDGGWGTRILGPSTMFGTCLNYVTLRLLGNSAEHDTLSKGRAWILSHGSATAIPQWGKIWLSVIGLYDWSGNNAIIPELWILPYFLPIHPGRYWCFSRLVYMPMAYLFGKKFVGPITPTILELRKELYLVPYNKINWSKACVTCAEEDLRIPRSMVQNIVWTCLNKFVEPALHCWPFSKIRDKALRDLMKHIIYEDETTQYVGACPVNKVLNMVCRWIENPASDAFKKHLPRIYDYLWLAEDGMKAKVYDGCQCWEQGLIIQAYCSTDLVNEYGPTLRKALEFLKRSQVLEDHREYKTYYRHRSKGSWTVSTQDNGWSVSDTTAEALQAVLLLSKFSPDLVGEPIKKERLYDAVDCLLSLMNADGTFSTYECKRTTSLLEVLNPCETFANIMVDNPCVECSSSVIQALVTFREFYPEYRKPEIESCIKNTVTFLEKEQRHDGSCIENNLLQKYMEKLCTKDPKWLEPYPNLRKRKSGTWGIYFTYGTLFAIEGLVAAGRTYNNSPAIRKACNFLLSKQLRTGGWGETYISSETEVYSEASRPHAVNTSWAMLALICAGQVERDPKPIYQAAKELINMQLESGLFPQQEHVGLSNRYMYFNYGNYRHLFPIRALGELRRRLVARKKLN